MLFARQPVSRPAGRLMNLQPTTPTRPPPNWARGNWPDFNWASRWLAPSTRRERARSIGKLLQRKRSRKLVGAINIHEQPPKPVLAAATSRKQLPPCLANAASAAAAAAHVRGQRGAARAILWSLGSRSFHWPASWRQMIPRHSSEPPIGNFCSCINFHSDANELGQPRASRPCTWIWRRTEVGRAL